MGSHCTEQKKFPGDEIYQHWPVNWLTDTPGFRHVQSFSLNDVPGGQSCFDILQ